MNPDDKFRGRKNFHERKADRTAAAGLPSDHQKPDVVSIPKVTTPVADRLASGGIVASTYGTTPFDAASMSAAINKMFQSQYFRFSFTASAEGPDVRFSGKEFAASAAKGCRSFKVDTLGRLRGIHYDQVWTPGENVSECRADKPHNTEDGFPNCKCGFYGYYDGSNDFYEAGYVSAVVQGWGEAVMGEKGFRVTKAKILALTTDSKVLGKLEYLVRRNYDGIPMFESFGEMVRTFQPDYGLNDAAIPKPTDDDFWTRDA